MHRERAEKKKKVKKISDQEKMIGEAKFYLSWKKGKIEERRYGFLIRGALAFVVKIGIFCVY